MKTINNLKEFFEARGFGIEENTMWYYGRCLYKYTFGPWVAYIVEDKPEEVLKYGFTVMPGHCNEAIFAHKELSEYFNLNDLPEIVQFFNMDDNEATYPEYVQLLKNFLAEEHPTHIRTERDWTADFQKDKVVITGTYTLPATSRYVYYEDDEANTDTLKLQDSCIGIEVGSIVEGSDVEIEPRTFIFPFDDASYDNGLEDLAEEVNFYWKRDNALYYSVSNIGGEGAIYCQWITFDSEPTGSFSDDQLELAVAAGNTLQDDDIKFTDVQGWASKEVPGFPGWYVTEEETPDYVY